MTLGDPGHSLTAPTTLARHQAPPHHVPEELKSAEGEEGACFDLSGVPGGKRPGGGLGVGCRAALLLDAQNTTAGTHLARLQDITLPSQAFQLCTLLTEMLFFSGQNNSLFRTKLHAEAGSKGTRQLPHDVFAHWREVNSSGLLREACCGT